MQKLTSELKSILYKNGAALVGCADLSGIVSSDLKYGVSIVMPVKEHIVAGIMDGPTEAYFDDYHDLEKRLSKAALCGEAFLQEHGYQAYAQTPQRVRENAEWRTELPHKTVATNAGIGWIGKSCLLVTEEYGSAIRLSSILTDAPLICDTPIRESRCGKCFAVCPYTKRYIRKMHSR